MTSSRCFRAQMEVYAGFLEHTDHHVGRVIDAIEDLGILDDTLIYYIIGDNGASAEGTMNGAFNEMANFNGMAALETPEFMMSKMDEFGSPSSYNHYSVGWAWAMDTPFQWTKQVASHWGGTRNGTIVHWPAGIAEKGGLRSQFSHVIDIAPDRPRGCRPARADDGQRRAAVAHGGHEHAVHLRRRGGGRSVTTSSTSRCSAIAGSTTAAGAPSPSTRRRGSSSTRTQSRSTTTTGSCTTARPTTARPATSPREQPERLASLQRLWLIEATKYNVLPMDDRTGERLNPELAGRPTLIRGDSQLFFAGMGRLSENSVVSIKNRSFSVTAEVDVPDGGAEGVIIAQGGRFGGWAVYAREGKARFVYNVLGIQEFTTEADTPIPAGQHQVRDRVRLRRRRPGQRRRRDAVLRRQGGRHAAASPRHKPMVFSADETTDIGYESGTTVSPDYTAQGSRFTGKIGWVQIDLGKDDNDHFIDPDERLRVAMARQ